MNISQRQLPHAALVKLVRRVLDETGLPPACLELEVRESELMRNPDLAIERLTELRRLGLRIALDDFGTGESRLAHLYRYPLDSIKIDGSVVSAAPANRDHEAVISAAIALARSRRLKVVAEGVESEAQRVSLVRWQCDRMQGSLCGPPATAAETERLLLRQRQATRTRRPRARAGAPAALVLRAWPGRSRERAKSSGAGILETLSEGGTLRRVRIDALPFRVGRRQGLELVLPAESVSKLHAEIYVTRPGAAARDLGSRNGCFVNRVLVEDAALVEGDIVHFADFEFRVGRSDVGESKPETARSAGPRRWPSSGASGRTVRRGHARAARAAARGQVTMVFQPIVLLARGTVAAYEALGRGTHPQLTEGPLELLQIAESIGREADLSRLFRRKRGRAGRAAPRPADGLPQHPSRRSFCGRGCSSRSRSCARSPRSSTSRSRSTRACCRAPPAIAELRGLLLERNIALAYDDFGAGQARLLELAEAPPHYLKFDQRFISGLDQAPLAKRRLLQSLLSLARELLVKTVAEGIETAAEARVCAEIGFTHAQGFHMGRPDPMAEL